MEPPGPAMPPGYRRSRKKSWTPAQGDGILNTYLMALGQIWYKNSTVVPPAQDEHIRNRARGEHRVLSRSESRHTMSSISIIGLGGMARAIAARAVESG